MGKGLETKLAQRARSRNAANFRGIFWLTNSSLFTCSGCIPECGKRAVWVQRWAGESGVSMWLPQESSAWQLLKCGVYMYTVNWLLRMGAIWITSVQVLHWCLMWEHFGVQDGSLAWGSGISKGKFPPSPPHPPLVCGKWNHAVEDLLPDKLVPGAIVYLKLYCGIVLGWCYNFAYWSLWTSYCRYIG